MHSPSSAKLLCPLAFAFLFFLVSPLHAHNSSKDMSALRMKLKKNTVEVQLAVSFPDTDTIFKFDKNGDDAISPEEIGTVMNELKEMASNELEVYFDNHRIQPAQVLTTRQESN